MSPVPLSAAWSCGLDCHDSGNVHIESAQIFVAP
jgi:hypothetical protein